MKRKLTSFLPCGVFKAEAVPIDGNGEAITVFILRFTNRGALLIAHAAWSSYVREMSRVKAGILRESELIDTDLDRNQLILHEMVAE